MNFKPVTLEGRHVRLEPLSMAHLPDLCDAGLDPELWRWTPRIVRTPEEMRSYVETVLRLQQQGSALPFTTIDRKSGVAVGCTRYMNIEPEHHRLEIGGTWLARPWQKTPFNTEAKYLMLQHAFETLGCIRVEFKTDLLNDQSRAALLRIGALQEGVFRHHMLTHTRRIRHTVYFRILNFEWPQIKTQLEEKLQRPFNHT